MFSAKIFLDWVLTVEKFAHQKYGTQPKAPQQIKVEGKKPKTTQNVQARYLAQEKEPVIETESAKMKQYKADALKK